MNYGRIYCVTHIASGKQYVGKTTASIQRRWKQHCLLLKDNLFQRAIAKYGPNSFKVEEICVANSLEELNALERAWITKLNSLAPNGYNLAKGGEGGKAHPATREKLSALAYARWSDPNFKARVVESARRFANTAENIEAARAKQKARWATDEFKAAMKKGKENPDYFERQSKAAKLVWARPGFREKYAEATALINSDHEFLQRRGQAIKAALARPDIKKKYIDAMNKVYADPTFLKRRGEAIKAAFAKKREKDKGENLCQ